VSYLLLVAAIMSAPQSDSVPARWAPLAEYLEASGARHAFPGAVVAIGRRDSLLFLHAVGRFDYEHGTPVTTRTAYDLASLTKVVGLTTAAMMLVDVGKLDLDAPVTRYVPAFAAGGDSVTVRHLLTHSSGLAAWRPFFQRVHSRAEMFALVNAEPLEAAPGARMAYSDLGAMLLTEVVEHVTGKRLDRFLAARLFGPLGMKDTRYLPPRSWLDRIAPTEMDTTWRHRLVRGEVHDENAASMGGVSGHAGLFSTAPDLVAFVQMLMRGGIAAGGTGAQGHRGTVTAGTGAQGHRRTGSGQAGAGPGGVQLARPETIALFTTVQRPGFSSRALGWDTPSENSSAGSHLSTRAFGHTGFTGTSIWVDPEQDLFVILLTNRVYPTRNNDLIREVRRQVADLAVTAAAGGGSR
jgi:CubicO group peptidase (beta-lactamase class C family)